MLDRLKFGPVKMTATLIHKKNTTFAIVDKTNSFVTIGTTFRCI
jgi:hypothetical protein